MEEREIALDFRLHFTVPRRFGLDGLDQLMTGIKAELEQLDVEVRLGGTSTSHNPTKVEYRDTHLMGTGESLADGRKLVEAMDNLSRAAAQIEKARTRIDDVIPR